MEIITSRKNDAVVHLRKLGADGGYRRETREFVCDGEKMLQEAVKWKAEIRTVMYTENAHIPELPEYVRICCASEDVLHSASRLKTPNRVLFSCAMPEISNSVVTAPAIVLENVQDPGNVGTVIRTADAFDVDVVLVGACADPFSPKTVQATMGAVFRKHVTVTDISGLPGILNGIPLYGATLAGDSRSICGVGISGAAAAIGSEGHGLSPEILSMCCGNIIIPISPRCESLNAAVAASVIMWEMVR